MRNFSCKFNRLATVTVFGNGKDPSGPEFQGCVRLLHAYLEAEVGHLTTSEERVLADFLEWYSAVDSNWPYGVSNVAFVYHNLNSGDSLLFLIGVPYEGCIGGRNWESVLEDFQASQRSCYRILG